MKITVIPFAKAIEETDVKDKTVIVIDVLRATSVMITALSNGAKEIIPAISIEEARKIAQKFTKQDILICGERDAKKIEGFDLGNSPLEFTREKVNRKSIVLTTTNGTKALNSCKHAKEVLIAAFLNAEAVAEKVKNLNELTLVCSGTNGKYSMDDGLCAGLLIDKISANSEVDPDDLGRVLINTLNASPKDLKTALKSCFHLNYLLANGYDKDVDYCLQLNKIKNVPVFREGKITCT